MSPKTTLGRLLQERREALGYSRLRLGELVGIKAATIEAWELGRVAKPPLHDVLKLARFLDIPLEELDAAALEDEAPKPPAEPRREGEAAAPLLEQAIGLFGWSDEQAAAALHATPELLRAWRRGDEPMGLPQLMTVAALLGLHAAGAAGAARIGDVADALARPQRPRT